MLRKSFQEDMVENRIESGNSKYTRSVTRDASLMHELQTQTNPQLNEQIILKLLISMIFRCVVGVESWWFIDIHVMGEGNRVQSDSVLSTRYLAWYATKAKRLGTRYSA